MQSRKGIKDYVGTSEKMEQKLDDLADWLFTLLCLSLSHAHTLTHAHTHTHAHAHAHTHTHERIWHPLQTFYQSQLQGRRVDDEC